MPSIRAINAIVVRTADPPALAAWYARFGLAATFEHEGGIFGDVTVADGTFCFGVVPGRDGASPTCVTLEVADAAAAMAELAAAGIAPIRAEENANGRFATFRDPDGNELELWTPPRPDHPRARFCEVHPVLPVRDVARAIEYYAGKLGFRALFQEDPTQPRYAVLERDGVHVHVQWHEEADFGGRDQAMLRFRVDDPDALFDEYRGRGLFHEHTALRDTPWGTREFAFFDLDGNGLVFYLAR